MNRDSLLRCFEDNPVILGMTSWDEFPLVKENESEIVFTLFGTVSNICQIVQDLNMGLSTVSQNLTTLGKRRADRTKRVFCLYRRTESTDYPDRTGSQDRHRDRKF